MRGRIGRFGGIVVVEDGRVVLGYWVWVGLDKLICGFWGDFLIG
jgi:hypothetical protein